MICKYFLPSCGCFTFLIVSFAAQKFKMFYIVQFTYVQAYLGDIADLVPDHCNKANISVKQVT